MPSIYDSPKSDLEVSDNEHGYRRLVSEQRIIFGTTSCVVAAAITMMSFFYAGGIIPGFLFFLPGVIGGFVLKVVGRPIQELFRLVPSLLVGGIVFLLLWGSNPFLWYLMPFLNFLLCYTLSRRFLSHDEETILFRRKIGRG